ncbi:MAG: N-6 DNA methylase [Planctomycetota bacterium]
MQFRSQKHQRVFQRVLSGLERLGYGESLLFREYLIHDCFLADAPTRTLPAAAFGREPPSYDTACIAVLVPTQKTGADLVSDYRALGAPVALEVREDRIVQWRVGAEPNRIAKWDEFPPEALARKLRDRKEEWSPDTILRGKNVFAKLAPRQLDFIDLGLIPALEHHVREKLDRLLHEVLNVGARVYKRRMGREPEMQHLFRLVFRFIAAKVLCDRRVERFRSISDASDPDAILTRVARYYSQSEPIIEDTETKEAVARRIWEAIGFQNLSVEALAYVYENTLVDEQLRRKLGTHSTPSSVARYVVSRLIDEEVVSNTLRIVEPCSGHAIFLVAALERLRDLLPSDLDPQERHGFFVRALRGFELDPFASEIGKLCLMLADFPFPDGWRLVEGDVFDSRPFLSTLSQADVVLCNPPFGDFSNAERHKYQERRAIQRPAELLHRVLDRVKSSATLGFVLPRQFLDGRAYRDVRRRVAEKYESVEIVALPDRVFRVSQLETALVIAKKPCAHHAKVTVVFEHVSDADRDRFLLDYEVTRRDVLEKTIAHFGKSATVPPLGEVWQRLDGFPRLYDVAELHRGIEWQPPFDEAKYISAKPKRWFVEGVRRVTNRYFSFQTPDTCHLSVRHEDRRGNAFDLPWNEPKAILNAVRVSRGPWRIAAFPDTEGLICSQNFFGIWPSTNWSVASLAAAVNGPVANAFVAVKESGRHNRKMTLQQIPLPLLTDPQRATLDRLVEEYWQIANIEAKAFLGAVERPPREQALRTTLLKIDALVLKGYRLPPRIERSLLDFFRGWPRRVSFTFTEYFSDGFAPTIPLWMYISEEYERCRSDFLLQRAPQISDPALIGALAEVE